jgi:hypothetical protein
MCWRFSLSHLDICSPSVVLSWESVWESCRFGRSNVLSLWVLLWRRLLEYLDLWLFSRYKKRYRLSLQLLLRDIRLESLRIRCRRCHLWELARNGCDSSIIVKLCPTLSLYHTNFLHFPSFPKDFLIVRVEFSSIRSSRWSRWEEYKHVLARFQSHSSFHQSLYLMMHTLNTLSLRPSSSTSKVLPYRALFLLDWRIL